MTTYSLETLPVEILGNIIKQSDNPNFALNTFLSLNKTFVAKCQDPTIFRQVLSFKRIQKRCNYRIPDRNRTCMRIAYYKNHNDKYATKCVTHQNPGMIHSIEMQHTHLTDIPNWIMNSLSGGHVQITKFIVAQTKKDFRFTEKHLSVAVKNGRLGAIHYLKSFTLQPSEEMLLYHVEKGNLDGVKVLYELGYRLTGKFLYNHYFDIHFLRNFINYQPNHNDRLWEMRLATYFGHYELAIWLRSKQPEQLRHDTTSLDILVLSSRVKTNKGLQEELKKYIDEKIFYLTTNAFEVAVEFDISDIIFNWLLNRYQPIDLSTTNSDLKSTITHLARKCIELDRYNLYMKLRPWIYALKVDLPVLLELAIQKQAWDCAAYLCWITKCSRFVYLENDWEPEKVSNSVLSTLIKCEVVVPEEVVERLFYTVQNSNSIDVAKKLARSKLYGTRFISYLAESTEGLEYLQRMHSN